MTTHCHECHHCIGPDEAALLRHQLTFMTRPGKWGNESKAAYHALIDGKPAPSALDDLAIVLDRYGTASGMRAELNVLLEQADDLSANLLTLTRDLPVCPSFEDGHRCTAHTVKHDVATR